MTTQDLKQIEVLLDKKIKDLSTKDDITEVKDQIRVAENRLERQIKSVVVELKYIIENIVQPEIASLKGRVKEAEKELNIS